MVFIALKIFFSLHSTQQSSIILWSLIVNEGSSLKSLIFNFSIFSFFFDFLLFLPSSFKSKNFSSFSFKFCCSISSFSSSSSDSSDSSTISSGSSFFFFLLELPLFSFDLDLDFNIFFLNNSLLFEFLKDFLLFLFFRFILMFFISSSSFSSSSFSELEALSLSSKEIIFSSFSLFCTAFLGICAFVVFFFLLCLVFFFTMKLNEIN